MEKLDYLPLSPRDDLDKDPRTQTNYTHYENKLLWALKNRRKHNIKNIAITGYYGAGKSSVLKTFIKRNEVKEKVENPNKDLKFLELSLATFHDEDSKKVTQDIESTILQQIFYKVEDKDIPASKFSKLYDQKDNTRPINNTLAFIIFIIFITSATFKTFEHFNLVYNIRQIFSDIASLFLFTTFLILTSLVFIYARKLRINKFTFKNIDIELSKSDSELSILNKFLNELIYFFRKTKYNVVVFEDIDRFDNAEIFSNLRELNFTLNNSDLIESIVFIYAIKNEQFKTAQDRTKFFDFILPIIPIVNYETSVSTFNEQLNLSLNSEGDTLVNDLFYFIDDMRIINNIINELKTYTTILGEGADGKNVSANKMIALIIYKNVEPNDFSKLLKNQGVLYHCIESKQELIKKKSKEIDEKTINLRKEIEIIDSEESESLEELRKPYLSLFYCKVKAKIGNNNVTNPLTGKNIGSDDLITELETDELFSAFRNDQIKTHTINTGVQKSLGISFKELESEISTKKYEDREKLVLRKNEVQENEAQIKKLLENQSNLSFAKFSDLISEESLQNIYDAYYDRMEYIQKEKSNNKVHFQLLYRIIYNEYIDKDYFLYLSDFKKLGFQKEDFLFIVRVKNNEPLEFNYPLQNKALVYSKLNGPDFKSPAVFNMDLIDHIFSTKSTDIQVHILKQFEDNISDRPLEFFKDYSQSANSSKSYQNFISLIFQVVSTIWNEVAHTEAIDDHTKTNIYQDIIKYAEIKNLNQIEPKSLLGERILTDENFINVADVSKTIKLIEGLDLKLNLINFNGPRKVLDFIYEQNRYTLTLENIRGFFNHLSSEQMKKDCKNPLTLVSIQEKLVKMNKYIFQDIAEYISNNSKFLFDENESILLKLINLSEEKLSSDDKIAILRSNTTKINQLSKIKEFDNQLILYAENKILPSWQNLIVLYENNDSILEKPYLVDEVVTFLNVQENSLVLSNDISNIEETEFDKKLTEKIILSEGIEDENYKVLVDEVSYQESNFTAVLILSESKREILIRSKFLALSSENIATLLSKEYYTEAVLLLEVNKSELEDEIEEIIHEFDEELFKLSVKSSKIGPSNLSLIINNYPHISGNSNIKSAIVYALLNNPRLSVNKEVRIQLVNVEVKESQIANLFNIIGGDFSSDEVKAYFKGKPNEFWKLAKKGKKPLFKNYEGVEKMLEKLELKGIISGSKPQKDSFRVNYVY